MQKQHKNFLFPQEYSFNRMKEPKSIQD